MMSIANIRSLFLGAAVAALSLTAGARTARAQWSGTNPLTTSSRVGFYTTAPNETSELTRGGLVRLRLNAASPGNTAALRLATRGINRWDIGLVSEPLDFRFVTPGSSVDALSLAPGGLSQINKATVVNGDLGGNNWKSGGGTVGQSGRRWHLVYAVNGQIQTSDAREKKDVTDLRYGMSEIVRLRPVSFRWTSESVPGQRQLGLIAQETQPVIPEVVVPGDSPADPLGMNYAELIPVLIRGIQTHEETLRAGRERIARLESRRSRRHLSSVMNAGGKGVLACVPCLGLAAAMLGFARRRKQV